MNKYYLFGRESHGSEQLLATFSTEEKAKKYVNACKYDSSFCRGLLVGYRSCEIREIHSDPELP